MRNLKVTDDRMREMKLRVASLHYSNPENGEETESSFVTECEEDEKAGDGKCDDNNVMNPKEDDDDLYLEPSVLSILKDFDPTGNRSQKTHSGKVQRKAKKMERGEQQDKWKGKEYTGGRRRREKEGEEKREVGNGNRKKMEKFTFSEERKQAARGRDSKREGEFRFQRYEHGGKG